jgi:hypothetical protein
VIPKIRQAITDLGGIESVLAIAAIGWGLSRLQAVVDNRVALLDSQAARLAEQDAALRSMAKRRHPAGSSLSGGSFPAGDVDPLGRGEVSDV